MDRFRDTPNRSTIARPDNYSLHAQDLICAQSSTVITYRSNRKSRKLTCMMPFTVPPAKSSRDKRTSDRNP